MAEKRLKIYVAGPYSKGDVMQNIAEAIAAADELLDHGFVPFVPHLTGFWHLLSPHEYEEWLAYDNEWLPLCDALLRLPGESAGADREVGLAQEMGMTVFTSMGLLLEALA